MPFPNTTVLRSGTGTHPKRYKRTLVEPGHCGIVFAVVHEHTFRAAVEKGGLNPYYFQMVNIREDVSWVHSDMKAATEKARDLARAAVQRVFHHKALETKH